MNEMSEETTYTGLVAIVGKPNVGKSTLLNQMLGVKVAPVTSKPQTTRKSVRGVYTEENRQIVFMDTPGLHRPQDALGEYINGQVRAALVDVDVVVWLVDLRRPPNEEDRSLSLLLEWLVSRIPVLLVGNKLDVARYPDRALSEYRALLPGAVEVEAVSAMDARAMGELRDRLLRQLPEGPFLFPPEFARSDQTPEDWSAEIVREEAIKRLREEVPYALAVKVAEFVERPNGLIYIQATLYVEREAHKPIVIGRGGRMLKEIGQAARKQLRVLMNCPVYLDLEVRVYPNWRRDREALRELGYG